MKIKDIALENRPRERFVSHGPGALSMAELLSIILQKGTRSENAIDMSNRLLAKFTPESLGELSLRELQSIPGVGPAKALQIKSIIEFSKRIKINSCKKTPLKKAKDIFNYAMPKIGDLKQENFIVILLDSRSCIINDKVIFVGTVNATLIHPREIFKSAIIESASSIVISHNHPSGDVYPSQSDIDETRKIFALGKELMIPLTDHVIISKSRYYSFKERNMLC